MKVPKKPNIKHYEITLCVDDAVHWRISDKKRIAHLQKQLKTLAENAAANGHETEVVYFKRAKSQGRESERDPNDPRAKASLALPMAEHERLDELYPKTCWTNVRFENWLRVLIRKPVKETTA